jgi:hypothetical protein
MGIKSPIIVNLFGNKEIAGRFIGFAKNKMALMKRLMSFQKLNQLRLNLFVTSVYKGTSTIKERELVEEIILETEEDIDEDAEGVMDDEEPTQLSWIQRHRIESESDEEIAYLVHKVIKYYKSELMVEREKIWVLLNKIYNIEKCDIYTKTDLEHKHLTESEMTSCYIETPEIITPGDGFDIESRVEDIIIPFLSSDFMSSDNENITHIGTLIQLLNLHTRKFRTILLDENSPDLLSKDILVNEGTYYMRIRYLSDKCLDSKFSKIHKFTTYFYGEDNPSPFPINFSVEVLDLYDLRNNLFFEPDDIADCQELYPKPWSEDGKFAVNTTENYTLMRECVGYKGYYLLNGYGRMVDIESPHLFHWGMDWKYDLVTYPNGYAFDGAHVISFDFGEDTGIYRYLSMDLDFSGEGYPERVLTDTFMENWLEDPPSPSFNNLENIFYSNTSEERLSNIINVVSGVRDYEKWIVSYYSFEETNTEQTDTYSENLHEWTGEEEIYKTTVMKKTGPISTKWEWINWDGDVVNSFETSGNYSTSTVQYKATEYDRRGYPDWQFVSQEIDTDYSWFTPDTNYLYASGYDVGAYGYDSGSDSYVFLPLGNAYGAPDGCLGGKSGLYANDGIFEDVIY